MLIIIFGLVQNLLNKPVIIATKIKRVYDNSFRYFSNLFDFAQFVDVALVTFHAVLGQVQVSRVLAELFLILRHLFYHLR